MKRAYQIAFAMLGILLLAAGVRSQTPLTTDGFHNGQAAAWVMHQTNFSDITFALTSSRVGAISGIAQAGPNLIVADSSYLAPPNNNRVLIYHDFDTFRDWEGAFLRVADVVVGQPDFSSSSAGSAANQMNQPVAVASDGTRLVVAEWGNNRVVIFNQIPESNGASADVVVGQPGFGSSGFGTAANQLRRPNGVSTDGTRLLITDTLNHRVLIYNRIPTSNGASADLAVGQPNLDSGQSLPAAANTLSSPMSATTDGQRLIVSDMGNNRILIYNQIPTQSGASADVVIGQPDFTSSGAGVSNSSLNFPRYAFSDGQRLLIVDTGNNRILIYNEIPAQNGAAADIVLGQISFTGLLESCAAANFAVPYSAFFGGNRLFVSDSFNRRIMGFQPGPNLIRNVLNAASYSRTAQTAACGVILIEPPIAPGGLATIFGTDLADTTLAAEDPLPTELGGVRVKFDGYEAPLFYVSPTQINVQVPLELTGYSTSVSVEKATPDGTVVSAAVPAGLADGAPGILTQNGTGEGPGVIYHEDGSLVTPDSPARPGERLTLLATGLGRIDDPTIVNGARADFRSAGAVDIGGILGENQTVTITIEGRAYSYTTTANETLSTIRDGLADLIDANDPLVSANVNDSTIELLARDPGVQGNEIRYATSVSPGATLTAAAGEGQAVPGTVYFRGIPEAGQTVTVALLNTLYSYTAEEGDTVEDFVVNLAESIDNDPNIGASADLSQLAVNLDLAGIPYSVSLSSGSLSLFSDDSGELPASIIFTGTPQSGQSVTVNVGNATYSHATTSTDSLETILNALAGLINAATSQTQVLATAGASTKSLTIESSVTLNIPYRVYSSPGPGLTAVETAPPETGIRVPGDIQFHGIPFPGEKITVFLANVSYSYIVAPGDTMAAVLENLADRISQDVNVSATADLSRNAISLQLKNSDVVVRFSTAVSKTALLTADPVGGTLPVDGAATATITFSGDPEAGQEARVSVGNAVYSYTAQPGDTAETVANALAGLIDADPIATATADLSVPAINLTPTPLTVSSGETVPGAVTISSSPVRGHSVTVVVQASSYTYTAAEGDTLESFVTALADRINGDANVNATADAANGRIQIELEDPTRNLQLTLSARAGAVHYAAAVSNFPGFFASPAYERFNPKTGNVSNTVSLALGEPAFLVPGSVLIGGTPEAGLTITVKLAETVYSYTTVTGDTLQSIVSGLAAVIDSDPNVSAIANLSTLGVDLVLRNPEQDPAPTIGFSASASVGSTVTVFVSGRVPTNTVNVAVVSAQMLRGSIGLYSVTFTLPLDLPPNSETVLAISQNLIVFGSVTQFNINSNPVTFAVIAP
jgi:uncharacterized protein (TIGR03437 family)